MDTLSLGFCLKFGRLKTFGRFKSDTLSVVPMQIIGRMAAFVNLEALFDETQNYLTLI